MEFIKFGALAQKCMKKNYVTFSFFVQCKIYQILKLTLNTWCESRKRMSQKIFWKIQSQRPCLGFIIDIFFLFLKHSCRIKMVCTKPADVNKTCESSISQVFYCTQIRPWLWKHKAGESNLKMCAPIQHSVLSSQHDETSWKFPAMLER